MGWGWGIPKMHDFFCSNFLCRNFFEHYATLPFKHTTCFPFRLCPKLDQYEKEFFASEMWQQHYNEKTEPLLAEVEKALGLKYKLSKSFIPLFQTIISRIILVLLT